MIEILRSRRSIRKYEKRPIDERSLEILKEALLRCPSSRGINPWTFIFVDEVDLLAELSQAKEHGSGFLKNAALAIVVCGDESESDVWVEDCSIAAIVAHLTAHSLGSGKLLDRDQEQGPFHRKDRRKHWNFSASLRT